MTTRDKPVMRLVIDTIEREGPMTVEALANMLKMSYESVQFHCFNARASGYLSATPYERDRPSTGGRKRALYTRTDVAYDAGTPTIYALKERERKRRERDNQRRKEQRAQAAKERNMHISKPFVPFRHPFDVILFGNCASSGRPSRVAGRVIQQSMSVLEEAEA